MSPQMIGPGIAILVNVTLGAWALWRGFRFASYRAFALLAVSVALWCLGANALRDGANPLWLRLSFIGLALAPANFLAMALAAGHRRHEAGRYAHLLLYLPALAVGVALSHRIAATPEVWTLGLYPIDTAGRMVLGVMMAIYIIAALWISWRLARNHPRRDWVFRLVVLPLAAGMAAILATAWIHGERTPAVAYWALAMSQYSMFMMVRYRLAPLGAAMRPIPSLGFAALVMATGAMLLFSLWRMAARGRVSGEYGLLLIVAVAGVIVLYAAVLPRIALLLRRLLHRRRVA